jgi:hypothetical protein
MPVIVVTRIRLKDPALLDEFFIDAVAAIEQAQKSEDNLGADALADDVLTVLGRSQDAAALRHLTETQALDQAIWLLQKTAHPRSG